MTLRSLAAALCAAGCAASAPVAGPAPAEAPRTEAPHGEAPAHAPPPPESAAAVLTLAASLDRALAAHPRLEQVRARVAAAEAGARAAGRRAGPEAVAGIESAPFDGATFGEAEYLLGVAQTLSISGRRGRAAAVGEREREAAEHAARAELLAVRRDVQGAFATALFAERAAELAEELAAGWAESVALTRARVDVGDAVEADLLRVEVELARARREARRAAALVPRTRVELARAIGDPALDVAGVEGELDAAFDLPALTDVVGRLDRNPSLLAARSRVDAAAARVELAGALRVPDARVELLYRRVQSTGHDSFDVRLGLPLGLGGPGPDRVRQRRHELAAARAAARDERSRLEAEARVLHAELALAVADLDFLEREVLPRARRLDETARARHALGDVGLTELLEARRSWVEARFASLAARGSVMRAWAALTPYLPPEP